MLLRRTGLRVVLGILVLFAVGFSIYCFTLFRNIEKAFAQKDEFTPTRIYSDVTYVAAPQTRGLITSRLNALGYNPKLASPEELTIELHPIEYPSYLIPDDHVTHSIASARNAAQRAVVLEFEGSAPNSPLKTIRAKTPESKGETIEISNFYLEPELIATLSRSGADARKEIRSNLKFNDIPAQVWQAIIAIEDQNFLEHKGLDPRGIARAIWVNLRTRSLAQGGSTITQQLIKNLMARRTRNIFLKINELFIALVLEAKYDKEQILERYLNEVYLGQVGSLEVHGVAEGAEHFFGKRVDELNLAEIALMAGLIRGPAYYSPYRYKERAIDRQKLVLRKMVEVGFLAEAEAKAALNLPVRLAPSQSTFNKAPYFTDFVKAEMIRELKDKLSEQEITSSGFRVYTTLDANLNSIAQRSVSQGIAQLEKDLKVTAPERLEGALAAVDQSNGFIRVLVGGRNYSESNFNRILNMKRQIGSTFKPIVYLSAFEKGDDEKGIAYGGGYPVHDAPWKLVYDKGRQNWAPKNYDKDFLGWITMRTALSRSVNTIAARLGVEVGIDRIKKTAKALGINSELPAVPSLSLGVAELSPVELLKAYATIANHGNAQDLTVIKAITQTDGTAYARFVTHSHQAVASGPIDLLNDILQNVFIDGTARGAAAMGFDRPAAGKTGTTSHHRDSWFAGYTPELTAVVWVGTDQNIVREEPAPNPKDKKKKPKQPVKLTGASSALPIWVNFMKNGLAGTPTTPFPESENLSSVRIDRLSGKFATAECPEEQTMVEKYVTGQEPKTTGCDENWPEAVPVTTLE